MQIRSMPYCNITAHIHIYVHKYTYIYILICMYICIYMYTAAVGEEVFKNRLNTYYL